MYFPWSLNLPILLLFPRRFIALCRTHALAGQTVETLKLPYTLCIYRAQISRPNYRILDDMLYTHLYTLGCKYTWGVYMELERPSAHK